MIKKVLKGKGGKIENTIEKISIEQMRSIWNDGETKFTDSQLTKMREWAYLISEVIIDIAKRQKRNNIIHLNPEINETEKSNIIYKGEYRRAS